MWFGNVLVLRFSFAFFFFASHTSQADNEQHARQVCAHRTDASLRRREKSAAIALSGEAKPGDGEGGGTTVVPLIVKGDVAGSVEAMVDVIKSRHPEKFELKVIQSGVGAISESDVEMAAASKGLCVLYKLLQWNLRTKDTLGTIII